MGSYIEREFLGVVSRFLLKDLGKIDPERAEDTAKKFGPIVIDYVAHHGGEDLVDKIRAALKI